MLSFFRKYHLSCCLSVFWLKRNDDPHSAEPARVGLLSQPGGSHLGCRRPRVHPGPGHPRQLPAAAGFLSLPRTADSSQPAPGQHQRQRHAGLPLRDAAQLRGQRARQVADRVVWVPLVRLLQRALRYGPEGPGTVCSVQWQCRSVTARSYIICLFIFCLLLPLLLMFFCYGRILLAVRGVTRQAAGLNESQAEGRVLLMVVAMVTGYLLCWTPYGVVAMLASFGRPGAVPPAAALIPALLAKTSTILNPVICVLLNNQFSRCLLHMISCSSEDSSADVSSSRSIWAQKKPTEEPNTDPALLPSTDHNVQLHVQV
ncbi:rhodopsin-like isoform X2 [Poeciliopsis prolifica]|uniref:rhodopsin-like isoform X2 n=1 Tax=Poeciliopsis prolifica TaxID=188132 RepID=UPI002412EF67|nr:rhodopsin-like isoform X2 [Poeciliopsis prolifica]